ncbi:MAG: HAMP domain-containing histidine kinase [Cyanobacteria bacterium]|nr:HAMP domain-containing histidine kinase [Cyanobacteriota bacterium]
MKIRAQMLLLLCVPLACQAATVGLLYSALAAVDKSAQQEIQAKRVMAVLQENSSILGILVVEVANRNIFDRKQKPWEDKWRLIVDQRNKALVSVVKDNPRAMKLARQYDLHSRQLVDNWIDLTRSYSPGHSKLYFSQFINSSEFTETMKVLSDSLYDEVNELLSMYRQVADDLQPQSLAARARLRDSIIAAVALNFILVLVVALIINTKTLHRLSVLMNHLRGFSTGGAVSESLSGNDELAELDRIFTSMANERHKLDQLRQSIREMVNHDMRSPLTSMNLRLESVLEIHDEELTPVVREHLMQLSSETTRLTRLANTLLDIDRMEDGKLDVELETVSVAELVNTSREIVLGHAVHRKLTIITDVEEALEVTCDLDRTIQVLTNLLSNAIKFSPGRTTISIHGRSADADWARIEVIDQGSGVNADKVESLFKRFVQLDQPEAVKAQGSGLGLYICKSLIEAEGGKIGYSQRDESGSCFWIELPKAN